MTERAKLDVLQRARKGLGPDERDVRALTKLLDLLYPDAEWDEGFTASMTKNESSARYLLGCNWFSREGVAVATRAAINNAAFWASRGADAGGDLS